ncbi:head closure Hc1 [Gordonia phage Gsput1]|uniref:Head-to-tail connector protein n=1 Tax=Gordonia phage Gsput1 TaxID=1622193 RepID=A0A0E3XAK9_9CAUD|nr:head closure Hc1 [Gordonia phage Gsput1]AKC03037.1 hypothetical protein Gsput1_12 [Gordonia phage Gsput1]
MTGLSQKQWDKVVQSRAVRAKVDAVAKRVAARAQALNDAEGGSATITVERGVRPKGRGYANVKSDRPDEEHGTETKARRAVLRRAARGG